MKKYYAKDYQKTAIHCPTSELAKKVVQITNLPSAFALHYWEDYRDNYVIALYDKAYYYLKWYEAENYKIIPAEEFIKTHTQSEIVEDFQIY